jgi:hypothetical protein
MSVDNTHVVNIYIRDNENDMPSPNALAAKYNVDNSESDDDNDETENQMNTSINNEIDFSSNLEMAKRLELYVRKVDEKNREIEKLCTLMESMSVPPGVDPSTYLDIYDGKSEHVDFRDSKIVSLAKKSRNLTVALNKEKGINASNKKRIDDLMDENERLKREIELISSPAARAAASKSIRESKDTSNDNRDYQKELANSNRQVRYRSIYILFEWIFD